MSVTVIIFGGQLICCFYLIQYFLIRPLPLQYHLEWSINSANVINELVSASYLMYT
jgi:hypothetical protein